MPMVTEAGSALYVKLGAGMSGTRQRCPDLDQQELTSGKRHISPWRAKALERLVFLGLGIFQAHQFPISKTAMS